jgi:protein gp37
MPEQYAQPFDVVQVMYKRLDEPAHWKKPQTVLVSSQGDLFHQDVSDEALDLIFEAMERASQHLFLVLTKRAKRMMGYFQRRYEGRDPAANIWAGVSIENQDVCHRLENLANTPAAGRWVSCEPLIGPVHLAWVRWAFQKINLVVGGAETGVGARPCHPDWARYLRDDCHNMGVKFWWKSWGEWWPAFPQYGDTDSFEKYEGDHENMGMGANEELCLGKDGTISQHWVGNDVSYVYQPNPGVNPWWMLRVGKRAAGRVLDGITWEQGPR